MASIGYKLLVMMTIFFSVVGLRWKTDSFRSLRFLPTHSSLDPVQPSHVLRMVGAGASSSAVAPIMLGYLDDVTVTSWTSVARGGFANIFHGVQVRQGKEIIVAIKVLHGNMRQGGSARRFFREVSIWKTLKHRNILPLYGIALNVSYPGTLGMVCPWIDKGDLTQYLQAHPKMSLVDRRSILTQIASALQYLHSRSIVHRDLTGNNILVGDNGNILLCDFGLTRIQTNNGPQSHTTSTGMFNAPWAAPEVVFPSADLDNPGVTTSSDVYSFGSVMLQVLSGHRPYCGMGTGQIIIHLDEHSHPPRPANAKLVSDTLWDFMLQCWARTPSERPSIEGVCSFLADSTNF